MSYYNMYDDEDYDSEVYDDYEEDDDEDDSGNDAADTYDNLKRIKNTIDNSTKNLDPKKVSKGIENAVKAGKNAKIAKDAIKTGKKVARAKEEVNAAKYAGQKVTAEAGKQAAKETGKQVGKEVGKEVGKGVVKEGAKTGVIAATEAGGAAAGPPGWVLDAVLLLSDIIKKEIKKRKNESGEKKAKRWIRDLSPLILIVAIVLLPLFGLVSLFTVGTTVTTEDSVNRMNDYVDCIQTNGTCSEILDIPVNSSDNFKGYNKPLMIFSRAELKEAAETYARFSTKYFEDGEGLFSESYSEIANEFGTDLNSLTKEEMDSAILANFFSMQARVFSQVKWTEVNFDGSGGEICTPITEFDVFYNSEEDFSDVLGKWFNWFDLGDYEIKIPLVSKYSVTYEAKETTEDYIVDNLTGEITENGLVSTDFEPNPKEITDEYKMQQLKSYIDMLKEFLPEWYEPYAVYLATGDVSYAKQFFLDYLNFYEGHLEVKLYNYNRNMETETVIDRVGTVTPSEGEPTNFDTTSHKKEVTHQKGYSKMVFQAPGRKELMTDNGFRLVEANQLYYIDEFGQEHEVQNIEEEKSYPKKIKENEVKQDSETYTTKVNEGEEDEKEITITTDTTTTTNQTLYRLDGYFPKSFKGLASENSYFYLQSTFSPYQDEKNIYLHIRPTYVFMYYSKSRNGDMDFSLIGAALESIYNFYENYESKYGNINDIITGINDSGYSKSDVEKIVSGDTEKGYDRVFTSSGGTKYLEFKQTLGYYKYYTYLYSGGEGTFYDIACPVTTASILLQYFGIYLDPYQVYKITGAAFGYDAANRILKSKGINATITREYINNSSSGAREIVDQLKKGMPVGIRTSWYRNGGHSAILLDYKVENNIEYVYCSAVHSGYNNSWEGWVKLSNIIGTIEWYDRISY